MQYELIQMEAKQVMGIKGRTSNSDPKMGEVIGGLWQQFYEEGIYEKIVKKVDDKSIGLYTHYLNKDEDMYDVVVCCAVSEDAVANEPLVKIQIPPALYAKFVVKGNMVTACMDFWTALPSCNLNRAYTYDFEEYQSGGDMENAEIHMYIAVNA